ncbi:MAG: hypothetical protein BWK80_56215 [Desulfobacteraceae bacterium IS3]|nr:MAG: hypothetical protein BWK80_56215 [Desulfobacteraceae bacterium IS3]
MEKLEIFTPEQASVVNDAAAMSEELVSDFYKMSASQWRRLNYDIKTLADLAEEEIVYGPFAHVIRYEEKRKGRYLGSSVYDFYKICLQDHSILFTLRQFPDINLFPFTLYIVIHELIHVVRFCKFLQNFDASSEEKTAEESRVHRYSREILCEVRITGIENVLKFYDNWLKPLDNI